MDNNLITLSLQDSSFAHCEYSNNPLPPVSVAKHIRWDRRTIDRNTIYTDFCIQAAPTGSVVWLIEPRELIPDIYKYVEDNILRFKKVLTHDSALLQKYTTAVLVPLGGCWIPREHQAIYPKTKMFSIIASGKRQLEGHQLRHSIITAAEGKIDVFGGGYKHIQSKLIGIKDYRYHIVVENVRKDFWFTEKLIDCLVTGTIPIYWGCPSISKFFNIDGFITFSNMQELKEKLKLCTPDYYDSKIDAIRENFILAQKHILAEDWIYEHEIHIP